MWAKSSGVKNFHRMALHCRRSLNAALTHAPVAARSQQVIQPACRPMQFAHQTLTRHFSVTLAQTYYKSRRDDDSCDDQRPYVCTDQTFEKEVQAKPPTKSLGGDGSMGDDAAPGQGSSSAKLMEKTSKLVDPDILKTSSEKLKQKTASVVNSTAMKNSTEKLKEKASGVIDPTVFEPIQAPKQMPPPIVDKNTPSPPASPGTPGAGAQSQEDPLKDFATEYWPALEKFIFRSLAFIWDTSRTLYAILRINFEKHVASNSTVQEYWKIFLAKIADARKKH